MVIRAAVAAVVSLLGAVGVALAVAAPPVGKIANIGILAPAAAPRSLVGTFEQSLQELGWISGKNVRIETRLAAGRETEDARLVAELVGLRMDVIVVWGTVGALTAKQSTSTVPVVFLATGDPVTLGLVSNLAHPGGNLTGVPAIAGIEEFAKRLALLKEAVPSVVRVALLVALDGRTLLELSRRTMTAAAEALKVELSEVHVATPDELGSAIGTAKRQGAQALYVWPSGFMLSFGRQLSEFALASRLPSIHPFAESAVSGGLLSYSASLTDIARRGAAYVDKILKGAKPADLPVEQPTKFELVINLKTAKALDLTIPPSLLLRADEVLQ